MQRTLDISGSGAFPVELRDDSGDQGASTSILSRRGGDLVLDCSLQKRFAWPYCGFFFPVGAEPQGLDLSQFETVTVDMEHEAAPPHAMRLYIRNFEPGLSVEGVWKTQKVNEIEFELSDSGPTVIPLHLLRPAVWWSSAMRVPLLHSGTAHSDRA